MVGASLLAGTKQQEAKPGERCNQKGAVARGVDWLGEERLARAALAIEEDVLAQCHVLSPFELL